MVHTVAWLLPGKGRSNHCFFLTGKIPGAYELQCLPRKPIGWLTCCADIWLWSFSPMCTTALDSSVPHSNHAIGQVYNCDFHVECCPQEEPGGPSHCHGNLREVFLHFFQGIKKVEEKKDMGWSGAGRSRSRKGAFLCHKGLGWLLWVIIVCTPNSYIKALTFIVTVPENGTLECYLNEALRLDGLRVLIGWGNWETAHIVKHLGFKQKDASPQGLCTRAVWWPVLVTPGW